MNSYHTQITRPYTPLYSHSHHVPSLAPLVVLEHIMVDTASAAELLSAPKLNLPLLFGVRQSTYYFVVFMSILRQVPCMPM